ncbi:MAG: hypothetical protein Q9166_005411, partial [cf. Caloplaca sp. 2 TL-2023]
VIRHIVIWPFHWLVGLDGALPPSVFGKENFPKVYAWIDRFSNVLEAAQNSAPKIMTLKGVEAIQYISQAEFAEPDGNVDAQDPLGLKKGQDVESWPLEFGFNHKDRGQLVALTRQEVASKTQTKIGHRDVHIHHPRTHFRIRSVSVDSESKL